ncbi:MAG: glycosyltransferase family 2 protein [Acidobacteriota bacterium]|nr:glycosyltransferase family 2 protein [Acidobacteriota bacterium]
MVVDSPSVGVCDLSVVVPIYNEIGSVDPLVERVRGALEPMGLSWELLAVDDGSTDGTGERLDELAAADERIKVLHFVANCGQSAGLDAGFKHAGGRLIALLDADLQTYPEDLPKLIEVLESEQVDAVVGIRAERHDTGWKRFSSLFANGVRNRLTREDIQDTGCPIKVFRAEAIRQVKILTGMHRFLPTLLRMEGFTVVQVPVRHAERVAGTSKYGTWDRAFSGLRDALGVRWMQDRRMKWKVR